MSVFAKRHPLCWLLGHSYYQGRITLLLALKPEGETWKNISHTSETIICRRCKDTPVIGMIMIGNTDTHIRTSPAYSVDGFRVYLDQSLERAMLPIQEGESVHERG